MTHEVFQGAATRERVAPNLYKRTTKTGDTVFEAVFRDVDGKQRRATLDARNEREAVRETRALLVQRDGGERVVAAGLTLDDVAEREYFPMIEGLAAAGQRSERNVDEDRSRYRTHVQPRLGTLRLGDVEPRHLADLIASMRARKPKPYAEATIDNVLGVIRALYRLARRRGYVSRSPVDGLDPAEMPTPVRRKAGRVLDEAALALLVRHAPERYRVAVTLLAYSGLRLSEGLGLLWRDVDFVAGELHVRQQLLPSKRGREAKLTTRLKSDASERTVPLFPAVEQALVRHLQAELAAGRGRDADPVLASRAGTPLNQRNVAVRGVEAAATAAGLRARHAKDLRASFCSLAGRRDVDPIEAAQLTGHSLAVWSKFYARSFGKPQRDEARDRMLAHGFGALTEPVAAPPLS